VDERAAAVAGGLERDHLGAERLDLDEAGSALAVCPALELVAAAREAAARVAAATLEDAHAQAGLGEAAGGDGAAEAGADDDGVEAIDLHRAIVARGERLLLRSDQGAHAGALAGAPSPAGRAAHTRQ